MTLRRDRLAVVVPPGAGLGFRLAGATVEEIAADDVARLEALLADPRIAVAAIEQTLLPRVGAARRDRIARDGAPVLLPFELPARAAGARGGESWVAELIREAIGYHVKLGGES